MSQLHSLISTVIASAMDRATRGATDGDLAYALLAALRRLRSIIGSQAGYSAACGLDDGIHDIFMQKALENRGKGPVALPPKGPNAARAALILEDAAMSCLTLNAFFKGNTALDTAIRILAERLADCLGGAPKWGEVLDELRALDDQDDETEASEQWTSAAVH